MLPIVIVDDAAEDIFLAVRVLKHCQIENPVTTLSSGEKCIHYFEGGGEFANRTLPCLLFLDLNMKPLSGLDVLGRLSAHFQSNRETGGSIVVMMSGVQDLKLVNEGYKLGASTFLVKPLRVEDVMGIANSGRGLKVERRNDRNILSLHSAA